MSPWLKPRLAALFCGTVLIGGATFLHAQNDFPAPAKTPEEAASNFYRFLTSARPSIEGEDDPDMMVARNVASEDGSTAPRIQNYGSVSRAQVTSFVGSNGQLHGLFELMAQQLSEPQFDARVTGQANGQTFVQVAPAVKGKGRGVVTIAEDGGYRVDLKATYARWNNLSGTQLDESWWRYTGIVSPSLARNGQFLNSNCQSNQKQIMLGILQYAQDYDEKYPLARNWIDVLRPYTKSEQLFKCPALGKPGNGYALNSKFAGKSLSSVNEVATTINIYETSNRARNVFAPFNGRAYRHEQNGLKGMNIGFADGHVKWFAQGKEARITATPEAKTTGFITISTGQTQ